MAFEDLKSQFVKQEKVDPKEMIPARSQLHYAIFTLQALSSAFVPFQQDWSHISFHWSRTRGGFFSEKVPGKKSPAVFGLLVESPTVLQFDSSEKEILRSLSLEGTSLEGLREWLREGVLEMGLDPQTLNFTLSKEMPPHEVAEGKSFRFEGLQKALGELKGAYSNAHLFLNRIHEQNPDSSPLRCWPHHFDMATLFQFEVPGEKDPKKTLGMGLSPGDHFYESPYYYVTPWPFPMDLTLPPLPAGGRWHLDEWQGAVLTHKALLGSPEAEGQFKGIGEFLMAMRQIALHFLKVGQKR